MAPGIAQRLPVALQQAVDQEQPSHRRHLSFKSNALSTRTLRPAQHDVEHKHQHQPFPEHWHRITDQGDAAQDGIDPSATHHRRHNAGRYAYGGTDQYAQRGEFNRGGKNAFDIDGDRVTGQKRLAEIKLDQAQHEPPELHQQRLVQPKFGCHTGILGCGEIGTGGRHNRINRHDATNQKCGRQ